jgi:signal transduction histidine kinase
VAVARKETGSADSSRTRTILAGVALLALIATLALSIYASRRFEAMSDRVQHAMSVKLAISQLAGSLFEAETGQRGYVLTGRPDYLKAYKMARPLALEQVDRLRELTAATEPQRLIQAEVSRLLAFKLDELQRVIELHDRAGQAAALAVVETDVGLHTMQGLQAELRRMDDLEDSQLQAYQRRQQLYGLLAVASVFVTSIVFGLLATVSLAWTRAIEVQRRSAEAKAARLRAENEALAERQRTLQFQERFLAILGHDLRNPLSSITMGLRLLRMSPASSQGVIFDRLERSASRMTRMIDQLLDLARGRLGGGIPVARAPADLGKIVKDVVDEARVAHPGRSLVVELAGDLQGEWDPDRMAQVVSNLVENAIRHGSADGAVSLTVRGQEQVIHLAVHNRGPALSHTLGREIFDPFRRSERDSKAAGASGLGLGLYIVREVVSAHGGRIEIASNEYDGTTFTVALPRATNGGPESGA